MTWGLKGYLLGTDNLGRNVFYRILKGGQMTMTVGFIAVIIQFAIGILVGGISGYYGGTVDILLMRLAEVVGSLPFIPLALILSALIGNKVSDVGRIIMIMLISVSSDGPVSQVLSVHRCLQNVTKNSLSLQKHWV